jgi:dTDP-4-amino-4,6-dideoxygalactose transaminase
MAARETVVFNDFAGADFAEELAAIQRVLESGWLILGNEVRAFEQAWAARCGVGNAVGVGNGLDAIEIGLRGLGIGPGDEVITTPMTAVATILGILRAGATPVLADIDPVTGLLDPASVERCIGPRTKAVLLVHLYGQMRDLPNWSALCVAHELLLLEDCAQSHDAQFDGLRGGAWGSFGAYSFYPTKNLGAAGDAGALVTENGDLAVLARSLRNYGQSNRYEHPLIGLNSRLDEVQAAILSVRLPQLTNWTTRRRQIAERYRSEISNPAVTLLAPPKSPENHVHHLFVVLTDDRSSLAAHLAEQGIDSLIHYPIPAHRQASLAELKHDSNGLKQAEAHAAMCLSIPCAPHLSDTETARVIDAVNAFRSPR